MQKRFDQILHLITYRMYYSSASMRILLLTTGNDSNVAIVLVDGSVRPSLQMQMIRVVIIDKVLIR